MCGPDNLRFQAQIFQAFLSSLNKKNTDKLLVHGTILDKDGRKISKTLGNVIDPIEQLEKFGLDPVRYYALAGLNTYSNSSWDEAELKSIWNSEVVNDWGNLLSRVLHLIDIKCNGLCDKHSDIFYSEVDQQHEVIKDLWSKFKVKEALQKTNSLVKYANKYITDVKPWASENYEEELGNLLYLINTVNKLYIPVFGHRKYDEILAAIEIGKKQILFNRIN